MPHFISPRSCERGNIFFQFFSSPFAAAALPWASNVSGRLNSALNLVSETPLMRSSQNIRSTSCAARENWPRSSWYSADLTWPTESKSVKLTTGTSRRALRSRSSYGPDALSRILRAAESVMVAVRPLDVESGGGLELRSLARRPHRRAVDDHHVVGVLLLEPLHGAAAGVGGANFATGLVLAVRVVDARDVAGTVATRAPRLRARCDFDQQNLARGVCGLHILSGIAHVVSPASSSVFFTSSHPQPCIRLPVTCESSHPSFVHAASPWSQFSGMPGTSSVTALILIVPSSFSFTDTNAARRMGSPQCCSSSSAKPRSPLPVR